MERENIELDTLEGLGIVAYGRISINREEVVLRIFLNKRLKEFQYLEFILSRAAHHLRLSLFFQSNFESAPILSDFP